MSTLLLALDGLSAIAIVALQLMLLLFLTQASDKMGPSYAGNYYTAPLSLPATNA